MIDLMRGKPESLPSLWQSDRGILDVPIGGGKEDITLSSQGKEGYD